LNHNNSNDDEAWRNFIVDPQRHPISTLDYTRLPRDPGLRYQVIQANIAAKRRSLPAVDANGHPVKKEAK
jgi:hypothetical protein